MIKSHIYRSARVVRPMFGHGAAVALQLGDGRAAARLALNQLRQPFQLTRERRHRLILPLLRLAHPIEPREHLHHNQIMMGVHAQCVEASSTRARALHSRPSYIYNG